MALTAPIRRVKYQINAMNVLHTWPPGYNCFVSVVIFTVPGGVWWATSGQCQWPDDTINLLESCMRRHRTSDVYGESSNWCLPEPGPPANSNTNVNHDEKINRGKYFLGYEIRLCCRIPKVQIRWTSFVENLINKSRCVSCNYTGN